MPIFNALFGKQDPREQFCAKYAQFRKCNALIRSNTRQLDREIANMKQLEARTKNLILQADKRAARNPQRRAQVNQEVRAFAGELVRLRKVSARLVTSKAQLSSVQMQVNEAFAARKIEGSIRASVGVMRDVKSLIRLPKLAGTMRNLSTKLMRAGIIEEMIDETLPEDVLAEDEEEETENEVDKVLGDILKGSTATTSRLPTAPIAHEPIVTRMEEEGEDEEDAEAIMEQMRKRLDAMRN
ncbi:Vacuolar protein sorting-associated protein 24 [Cladobotryum mycophilum]|uniref:Vacuolar protein sorting-associated protein 24 n=1 Tax=Cladobotryum mycophilum TaxID=491253 RepID=A0ABR0SI89_9HYPO